MLFFIIIFPLDDSCLKIRISCKTSLCRNKRETRSYVEISESLGVDKPSDILFVTDVYQEATAATAAGMNVFLNPSFNFFKLNFIHYLLNLLRYQ